MALGRRIQGSVVLVIPETEGTPTSSGKESLVSCLEAVFFILAKHIPQGGKSVAIHLSFLLFAVFML